MEPMVYILAGVTGVSFFTLGLMLGWIVGRVAK